MTVEASIQTVLASLASMGAWQDVAAQDTVAPYIVWSEVVSTTNNTLLGASNTQNTRIQIDCYSKTQTGRTILAQAVIAAMAAAPFQNVQISSQNIYESDVKLSRIAVVPL